MIKSEAKTIDQYIADFPAKTQELLKNIRDTIRKAAPEAEEKISYNMPCFYYHGNLVYFAAFKNHIGFYALPEANIAFQKELAPYKTSKGTIQLSYDQPIPYRLIEKIVEFRIQENLDKEMLKKEKKSSKKRN
jgi:uncharacterized protein YdhG (YjbR/CyaY superfamily)